MSAKTIDMAAIKSRLAEMAAEREAAAASKPADRPITRAALKDGAVVASLALREGAVFSLTQFGSGYFTLELQLDQTDVEKLMGENAGKFHTVPQPGANEAGWTMTETSNGKAMAKKFLAVGKPVSKEPKFRLDL